MTKAQAPFYLGRHLCPKSVDLALTPVVSLGDMRRRKGGCYDLRETLAGYHLFLSAGLSSTELKL